MKIRENISDHTAAAIRKVRHLFFPAWYLPNGTINATKDELDGASESCERWSVWCGALVLISVAAEFIIDLVEPSYALFLRLSAFTGAGVAIGIVGEVSFSMKDARIQTELRRRSNDSVAAATQSAAEANERAATALKGAVAHELQLREMSRPRAFDVDKFKENLALEPRPGARAEVLYVRDCPDCWWLSMLIWGLLKAAGWEIVKQGPIPEPADKALLPIAFSVKGRPHGITVVSKVATFFPAIPPFMDALQGKNSRSGVVHFALVMATGKLLDGVIGQVDESMPDDMVRIVIAPRP